MRVRTVCALGALLLGGTYAYGDDSSAALGAGGIVFTKNTPVRMAAEDLYVSPKAVRVRFVFANDTARDVETVVAFPLPDIDMATFWGSPIGTMTEDPRNFVGFSALVNGKPIAFKIEQRAFLGGRDVTGEVLDSGLPVNLAVGEGYQRLDKLPLDARKRLKAAGLVDGEDLDDLVPQWVVRTRFYWTLDFPAHATTRVEHSYQPVTGQSFFGKADLTAKDTGRPDYCFDGPTRARIAAMSEARLKRDKDGGGYLEAFATDYILTTARNWNGPIGRFHLVLDKLKPDNAMSLCWAGPLTKTGPTTYESTLTGFSPAADIHLLVLE